jgi:hypothetical protein
MVTNIELEKGEWSRFISKFIDTPETLELSDDEGNRLFFSPFFCSSCSTSPTTEKRYIEECTKPKVKRSRNKEENDDVYVEPSNSNDIAYAEKTLSHIRQRARKESNVFLSDIGHCDYVGFQNNQRTTKKMSDELKTELSKTRDIFNDPDVKLDGTHLIINLRSHALAHNYTNSFYRRPLNIQELRQLEEAERVEYLKNAQK